MKASVLKALLEQGKKPFVKLMGTLWDDSYGEAGMIAQVISVAEQPHDNQIEFDFDYNKNREHNLALDKPTWYVGSDGKQGTAIEAGHFDDPNNIHETVVFEETDEVAVELVAEESPLAEYLASGSKIPYVEWLEAKLEELVPDCMKTWKKGL